MTRKDDIRSLIHTPAEMMRDFVSWAESIQADPGIQFGIPAIDKKVIPLRAGNLVSIIARPGHAKTSLLVYLARQEGKRIVEQGREGENVVVYVTWEQTSEELTSMLLARPDVNFSEVAWGRADLDTIKRRSVKGAAMPIWIIGHGITNTSSFAHRMSPEVVLNSIESMHEDFNLRPSLVLCDYLQLIPTRVAKERVQQVTEMPILLKELALRCKVPVVAAVQAARAVDDRDPPIPGMSDAQWASSIEQTSDKIFGLWRPAKTHNLGEWIEVDKQTYEVSDNLMVIRLLKQRGELGRFSWAMYFDPALMRLAEIEEERR